eukprot:TRINITY_DN13307_c0_g1_i2.p1 TRINITY_DN13307_c0_g1~~TRINITY_DN13307_c0_g1_i2.p1  ORF type:complete len:297 (+),score=3.57 TRINITY_DN13307_c0_g1_i2:410-1300(+)
MEFIVSNGTSNVANTPIEQSVNQALDAMSRVMDTSMKFSSSDWLSDFYRLFNSFNLCENIFSVEGVPDPFCSSIADGVLTMGINALNTYLHKSTRELLLNFQNSDRSDAVRRQILNREEFVEIGYLIDNYLSKTYDFISQKMSSLSKDVYQRQIIWLWVLTIGYTLALMLAVLIFIRHAYQPLRDRYSHIKQFFHYFPLQTLLLNNQIKQHLIRTSPKSLAGLKLQISTFTLDFFLSSFIFACSLVITSRFLHQSTIIRVSHNLLVPISVIRQQFQTKDTILNCLLYTSPSPRDQA